MKKISLIFIILIFTQIQNVFSYNINPTTVSGYMVDFGVLSESVAYNKPTKITLTNGGVGVKTGENLIKDPFCTISNSWELNMDGSSQWWKLTSSTSTPPATNTILPYDGGPKTSRKLSNSSNTTAGTIMQRVPVEPDEYYYVSAMFLTSLTTTPSMLLDLNPDKIGGLGAVKSRITMSDTTVPNVWKQVSVIVKIPSDTAINSPGVNPWLGVIFQGPATPDTWVTNVEVYKLSSVWRDGNINAYNPKFPTIVNPLSINTPNDDVGSIIPQTITLPGDTNNLIMNGDFSLSTRFVDIKNANLSRWFTNNSSATISDIQTPFSKAVTVSSNTDGIGQFGQRTTVINNSSYYFSFWSNSSSANLNLSFYYNKNDVYPGARSSFNMSSASNEWKKYEFVFTVPNKADGTGFPIFEALFNAPVGGNAQFADVVLYKLGQSMNNSIVGYPKTSVENFNLYKDVSLAEDCLLYNNRFLVDLDLSDTNYVYDNKLIVSLYSKDNQLIANYTPTIKPYKTKYTASIPLENLPVGTYKQKIMIWDSFGNLMPYNQALEKTQEILPEGTCTFRRNGDKNSLGVWWWHIEDIKGEITDSYLKFLQQNRVNEIYLCIDKMEVANYADVRNFVKKANSVGIQVAALSGDVSWLEPGNTGFETFMNKFNYYQALAQPDEKFYGVHLDIEPGQYGDVYLNERAKILQWFADLVSKQIWPAVKEANTKVEWDLPMGWFPTDLVLDTDGTSYEIFDFFAKYSDAMTMMSYRDTADLVYSSCQNAITAAKKYNRKIVFGVETGISYEGANISFFEDGKEILAYQLALLNDKIKSELPLGSSGIAVHYMRAWYDLKLK